MWFFTNVGSNKYRLGLHPYNKVNYILLNQSEIFG